MPNLIKRKFLIGENNFITHLQYLSWPDHSAPEEKEYSIISHILSTLKDFHNR